MRTQLTSKLLSHLPGKAGSSITEVLIALVIFAIFISGACGVILGHRQVSDQARAHYIAVNIAKNQIEQVRTTNASSFSQIMAMEEDDTPVNSDGDGTDSDSAKFLRTTEITDSGSFLLNISVTVKIRNPKTRLFPASETVESFMAHQLPR